MLQTGIERISILLSHPGNKRHTFLLPCQLRFAMLSLVRIKPRRRYHANTLVFSGIFIFQIILLFSTNPRGWIIALYMESTENLPFSFRFQQNSFAPCVKWTKENLGSNSFQDASWGLTRSLRTSQLVGMIPSP
jgi:hypothetical protein